MYFPFMVHPLILILPHEPTEQVHSLGRRLEAAAGVTAAVPGNLSLPVSAQDTLYDGQGPSVTATVAVDTERKRGLQDKPPGRETCYTAKGVTELGCEPMCPYSQTPRF